MRPLLLTLLALAACRTYPGSHPSSGSGGDAGQAGSGGMAGASGGGGAGQGGSGGGAGGSGGGGAGGQGCGPVATPVVELVSTGDPAPPGTFDAGVVAHRQVAEDEVPASARGATHVLHLQEIRGAPVERLLYYRAPPGLEAPVRKGEVVRLFYEEYQPAGRSAAAVLRDAQGELLWAILDGSFEPLPLTSGIATLEPEGDPLCTFEACGEFERRPARVTVRGQTVTMEPGQRAEIAGGRFALLDHVLAREPMCTETPLVQLGWVYLPGPQVCGGRAGAPCGGGEYCDFADDMCGASDATGVCRLAVQGCTGSGPTACGCDGVVRSEACLVFQSGVDLGRRCRAPPGMFRCGPYFCSDGSEYCQITLSDVAGVEHAHSCLPFPSCAEGGCACLPDHPCGLCVEIAGNVTVTCPGG